MQSGQVVSESAVGCIEAATGVDCTGVRPISAAHSKPGSAPPSTNTHLDLCCAAVKQRKDILLAV